MTKAPTFSQETQRLEDILAKLDDSVRMLRLPEVIKKVGLSRTSIYDLMQSNGFPKPYKIGVTAVAWLNTDIKLWMAEKITDSKT